MAAHSTNLMKDAADESQHTPSQMATSNRPINLGKSMDDDASRLDAIAKVTGKAKYGRDMYLDNLLFVGFIRCPFGAARLTGVDEAAAKQISGCVEVKMTGQEGQYHGHPVGHIVAESKTALRRAMRALNAQWERQPVQTRIEDSAGDPPPLNEESQTILAAADHVVEAVYTTPVQTHSALETHGVVVDHHGDQAVVYASTQGTFSVRDGIGDALGLPRSNFDVCCEYVGGGFGAKFGPGKEGMIAAEVAAKYKRPVSLFVDRDEEHLDTGNRPSSRTYVKLGITGDGTILGGQVHTWGGVGVANRGGGVRCPSGRYELGTIQREHEDISFNAGGPRAMRAPGHPQGAFAEELMLDEAATLAGVDPLELRIKLDVDDDRRDMYRLGSKLIGWNQRKKTGSQSGTKRRGFGIGSASWPSFPSRAEAEVVINRDGSVEARTGTQDIGTGQRTVMGILVADALGIPLRSIRVSIGSSALPEGPASGGSVTSPNSSMAMTSAAMNAKQKLLTALAERDGGDASEYELINGDVVRNGERILSWAQACERMGRDSISGRGENNDTTREVLFGQGHSHGAQFVDLEVDTEAGVIHVNRVVAIQACGRVMCRKTAESQIIGGVIQGISYALFEDKLLDRVTGAMVNPNLEMYKILGSADMPHIEPVLWDRNQTGVRSLGEPPVIPTAAAVACAVFNAIGSPVRDLPLTPNKLIAAMQHVGGAA